MTTQSKPASPLPWTTGPATTKGAVPGQRGIWEDTTRNRGIADVYGYPENAAYIVAACNRYPLLIGLLRDAREGFRDQAERDGGTLHQKANAAYESINNALKELGGV